MFGNYFYNESMRRMTIAFGQLFNKIQVRKKDDSQNTIQSVIVPLSYAPKEKFLVRLDQQYDIKNREFAVVLPRMSFEITGIAYDGNRKLNRVQKFKAIKSNTNEELLYNYSPVPYDISYSLYVFTATAESGLQIVEQILPFFQPDYTVTVNAIPELNIKRDIPIVLNTVTYEDSYSGDFTTRRAVIYSLNFTAKTYLFGPVSTQSVIKSTKADLFSDTDINIAKREERITVVPDPTTANANDDFGFSTTIEFFTDGKRYDPETGNDL